MARLISLLAFTVLLVGCAVVAPRYTPQVENIQMLKHGTFQSVKLGTFQARSPDVNRVRLRASAMDSPVGTFELYLEEALRQELSEAGLLTASSDLELSGILLRNDVSASGFKTGTADLEASFTVRRAGRTVYERTKSAHHEWESSFSANTAVPAAVLNYPIAVQKLVRALVGDPEFQNAIRK